MSISPITLWIATRSSGVSSIKTRGTTKDATCRLRSPPMRRHCAGRQRRGHCDIAYQSFVVRSAIQSRIPHILGPEHPSDGELVFDQASLLTRSLAEGSGGMLDEITMSSPLACVGGQWSPTIDDPTLAGWATVCGVRFLCSAGMARVPEVTDAEYESNAKLPGPHINAA